jgi:hypothetical protein
LASQLGWSAFLAGVVALAWVSLEASGGRAHLFEYSAHVAHKFTASAMLHGALNLRRQVFGVGHDEQVYNGAAYTNWGFGVPLLELPFHAVVPALRRWIHAKYFPDRFIFFLYLTGLLPLLWSGVHAMIFPRDRPASRRTLSWGASWCVTLFVLTFSLYDLVSFRFIVYEETIAYFVVFELAALSFYALFLESNETRWVVGAAISASVALVVRPTGLPYLVLWAMLIGLRTRSVRALVPFVVAAAPGVVFWMATNVARSGGLFALGFQNCNPAAPVHFQMQRFGSQCVTTAPRFREVCAQLFQALFLWVPPPGRILGDCGFMWEGRLPGEQPFLAPWLLLLLVVSLGWAAMRRERRIFFYLPHGLIASLFLMFARGGVGFAWRYEGDFWPAFVVLGLTELRRLAIENTESRSGLALASAFFAFMHIANDVTPALRTLEIVDQNGIRALEAEHEAEQAMPQPPLPARRACGQPFAGWARGDGLGWAPNCAVALVTNVYLAVPPAGGRALRVRLGVDHPPTPTLPVFVNGRTYEARLQDQVYEAEVSLDPRRFRSPVALATVDWKAAGPSTRLMWIELAP